MMSTASILSHTPIWAWFLLAYLLLRGIKALQPREVPLSRALIIPLVFLVWAVYGMFTELTNWLVAMVAFFAALAVGFAGGWANSTLYPIARFDPATGLLWRPGSVITLVLVILAFISKYILSAALAMHPNLGADTRFVALFSGTSGLVDGAFWGITVQQFRQAFRPRAAAA